jgi:hypothetical protein
MSYSSFGGGKFANDTVVVGGSIKDKTTVIFYTPSADVISAQEQREMKRKDECDESEDREIEIEPGCSFFYCNAHRMVDATYKRAESTVFYAFSKMIEGLNKTNAHYSGFALKITCPVNAFYKDVAENMTIMWMSKSGIFKKRRREENDDDDDKEDRSFFKMGSKCRGLFRLDSCMTAETDARRMYTHVFKYIRRVHRASFAHKNEEAEEECGGGGEDKHCCHCSLNGFKMDSDLIQNSNISPKWYKEAIAEKNRTAKRQRSNLKKLPCRLSFLPIFEGRSELDSHVTRCEEILKLNVSSSQTERSDFTIVDGRCGDQARSSALSSYGKMKMIDTWTDPDLNRFEPDAEKEHAFERFSNEDPIVLSGLYDIHAISWYYKNRHRSATDKKKKKKHDDDDAKPIDLALICVPNFSHVELMLERVDTKETETFAIKWGERMKKTNQKRYIYNDNHNAFYTKKSILPGRGRRQKDDDIAYYDENTKRMTYYLNACLESGVSFSKFNFFNNHFKRGVRSYLFGQSSLPRSMPYASHVAHEENADDKATIRRSRTAGVHRDEYVVIDLLDDGRAYEGDNDDTDAIVSDGDVLAVDDAVATTTTTNDMVCSEMVAEAMIRLGVFRHVDAFDFRFYEAFVTYESDVLKNKACVEQLFNESELNDAITHHLRAIRGIRHAIEGTMRLDGCVRIDARLNVYVDPKRASPNDVWCAFEMLEHFQKCPHCHYWKTIYYDYLLDKTEMRSTLYPHHHNKEKKEYGTLRIKSEILLQ